MGRGGPGWVPQGLARSNQLLHLGGEALKYSVSDIFALPAVAPTLRQRAPWDSLSTAPVSFQTQVGLNAEARETSTQGVGPGERVAGPSEPKTNYMGVAWDERVLGA